MVKNPYFKQNSGRLPTDPPNYLGTVARETWRKIIPFLEATEKVERIDTFLVETTVLTTKSIRKPMRMSKKTVSKPKLKKLSKHKVVARFQASSQWDLEKTQPLRR